VAKFHFTDNLSNGMLLTIIGLIVGYAFLVEKYFTEKGTNMFDSFVHGAKDGFTTGPARAALHAGHARRA
jgi:hypothetical protein